MPRVSRLTTEFSIPSDPQRVWSAEFTHFHASKDPVTGRVQPVIFQIKQGSEAGKFVDVQHVTICRLRYKGQTIFLTGHAPCSMGDTYNWRKGVHYSLQRALEKGGFCKMEKRNGKMCVVERKPLYDEVCNAFWTETFKKIPVPTFREAAQQPVIGISARQLPAIVRPVEHGMGAVAEDHTIPVAPENQTPLVNRVGLGYAGMD